MSLKSTTSPPSTIWATMPADEPAGEEGQVPARRAAQRGHGEGDDRKHRHRDADEPVGELDDRMERGHGRQVVLVARGPVRATEPGAGQPHSATAQDQQRVADHRSEGHLAHGGGEKGRRRKGAGAPPLYRTRGTAQATILCCARSPQGCGLSPAGSLTPILAGWRS